MGFLDKNDTVLDMIITSEGKRLLSKGDLNFVYWRVFDEGVDYEPYIANSASLGADALAHFKVSQMDTVPVREAVSGYSKQNPISRDRTNVADPLFTIPQGQSILPKIIKIHRTGSQSIGVYQEKIVDRFMHETGENITSDRGFNRFDSSKVNFEYKYTPNSYPLGHYLEGFKVKVYLSGTAGLVEIDPNHDLNDDIAFKSDLKIVPKLRTLNIKNAIKIR